MATIYSFDGKVLYEGECSIKELVEKNKKNLRDSDLSDLDLSKSNLRYSDLSNSDLRYSNLNCSDLSHSNLSNSILCGSNFSGTNLRGTNLSKTDLRNPIGNGREIISLQTDNWMVVRTSEVMQIGCQNHPIEDWFKFSDEEIDEMDSDALRWWNKWKPVLKDWIKNAPAAPSK